MSFLDIVRRARAYLHEQQRVSLRALRREFDLDDDALEELACELVDVQRVAVREGSVLVATAIQAAAPDATPTVATPSPEPADTERRQVTVLFCDLVGSTELSTRIDAEDFGEAIRAYHEAATQVVTRFGGYVAQLLGDGLGSRRRRRHVTSTRAIFRGRCRTSSGASSYTIPARMGLWRTRWDSMVALSSATMRPCVTCTLAIPTGRWRRARRRWRWRSAWNIRSVLRTLSSGVELPMSSAASSTGRGNASEKWGLSPSSSGFRCTLPGGCFCVAGRRANRGRARRASRRCRRRWASRRGSRADPSAILPLNAGRAPPEGRVPRRRLGALGLGVARAEQQGQHFYDAELHRLRAEILLEMDGNAVEEAEALFGDSPEIARRQEAKTFELRTATSLARLWQRQGKRDAARALLVPLYAWFTEGFDTRDLIDAKTLLQELRD